MSDANTPPPEQKPKHKAEPTPCPYCGETLVPMLGGWGCPLDEYECAERARQR
jgi:hypothetical protein